MKLQVLVKGKDKTTPPMATQKKKKKNQLDNINVMAT